jgi:putative transcriptional regulator
MDPRRRQAFQKYRSREGLSQRRVSLIANVSESHIRSIESGRGNPDVKLMFKLCRILNATPDELFPDLADVTLNDAI